MGLSIFSKVLRYLCLAAVALAAGFLAVVASAQTASAQVIPNPVDNKPSLKNWDSDNLLFPGYSSASFRIPSHSYGTSTAPRYSHAACGHGGIADGFYQTRFDVNDFPVLQYASGAHSIKRWGDADLACDEFVRAQERMISEAATNGGHWLDKNGNLRKGTLPVWIGSRPASLYYGPWAGKGERFGLRNGASFVLDGIRYHYTRPSTSPGPDIYPITTNAGYLRRVDAFSTEQAVQRWAIYPTSATLTVLWGQYTSSVGADFYEKPPTASTLDTTRKEGTVAAKPSGLYSWHSFYTNRYLTTPASVGGDHAGSVCPSGFHPRGADSVERIGNTTGRTLSHLTHTEGTIADRYWCRSDLRFLRKFYPYTRPGVGLHPQAIGMIETQAFYVYGRVNCFYTADRYPADATNPDPAPGSQTTGLISLGDNAYDCEYPYHPLPLCDPDPDNGSNTDWRAYTKPEIKKHGQTGQRFRRAPGADCGASGPPSQAGFTADPCVTATLSIYENRPSGENAEPGVVSSDRTLAAAAGRTAWDMDITSPHPKTASPPRDGTGCDLNMEFRL